VVKMRCGNCEFQGMQFFNTVEDAIFNWNHS
jgi:hypothetical protein